MKSYQLPGITKIETVSCSEIETGAMEKSMAGLTIAISATSTNIGFVGKPTLKWDSSAEKGGTEEKSVLEFRTLDELPRGRRLAFVVTCAGGEQYLVGTKEGRYPVVECSSTTGEAGGTASARTYKITHVAKKSVLRCVL